MLKIINKTDVYVWVLLPDPPFPQKLRIWGLKMLNWPPESPAITQNGTFDILYLHL